MHAGRFMNLVRASLLGLVTLTGSGCFTARPSGPDWFYHHAARNLTEKPIANHDERKFTKLVERRAAEAWEQLCQSSGRKHSDPYGDGFREGFVDYVEAGGTGEPPYLPPFRYRLTKYRTADGVQVIESWYAGFRHGAAVARESGLRELNYVPLPGPAVPHNAHVRAAATVPPLGLTAPPTHPVAPQPAVPGGAPESLPPPRPVGPVPLPRMPEPNPPTVKQGSATPALAPEALAAKAAPPPTGVTTVAGGAAKPPTAIRPPVVTLDRGPTVPAPTAVAAKDAFGPWEPARPRAPSIVRDP